MMPSSLVEYPPTYRDRQSEATPPTHRLTSTIQYSYHRHHLTRRPDWRWCLAQRLARCGIELPESFDDPWLRLAADYLRLHSPTANSLRGGVLSDVREAHEIYQSDSPARWEIEARILAGEQYAAIAEKLGMRIRVVKAFQNLFFHAKPRLACRDYIHNVVIGTFRPWDPTRVRDLWCYFAFSAGPEMVDFLVSDYRSSQKADYGHLIDGSEPNANRSTLGRKFDRCLKMMFLPVNEKTILPLVEMRIELMAAERREIDPLTENGLAASVDSMLQRTPRRTRGRTRRSTTAPQRQVV